MMARTPRIDRLVVLLTVLLLCADAAVLSGRHYLRRHSVIEDVNLILRDPAKGAGISIPVGFIAKRAAQEPEKDAPSKGMLIRYASRTCLYCQKDQPFWRTISQEALREHYAVTIVTPSAADEYASSDIIPAQALQMSFVSLQWLGNIRLRGTPTTLIAGPDHKILWVKEGALDDNDVVIAKNTLRKATE